MDECFGNNFILNGDLKPSDFFDNSMVYEGESVYEVIRMVNGSPVFYNDHIERLINSVRILKKDMMVDSGTLRHDILNLSHSGSLIEANLKIVFNYNSDSFSYLIYFIEPIYPTPEQYNNGVKGILFNAERRDPASKVINHKLRSDIYHKLILESAYEALLVDHNNRITEGSRSNIFFIRDNMLFTAPDGLILCGITRKYILDICRENSIRVVFECVNANTIVDYDSAFMSGTSPMVLPFNTIGRNYFDVKLPLMAELRKLYINKTEESIRQFTTD